MKEILLIEQEIFFSFCNSIDNNYIQYFNI